ncbi:sodium:solute symporter family protein [Lentibacillus salicampi]|uniref:Sodium:solute symporter family protein n=1 Tax=Lentibacillus salicampi TaxID=175306 RepID=A0A4Y9A8E3_9BACI|nr:sodium:solute symporter family protein [Lentibacillus salicampi]TFJ92098.1 sodium:solute symporter family protein [Lentibacillus salicampi]
MTGNQLIYLLMFIMFVFLMIGIGIWVSKRVKSGEDFLMGGRDLGVLLLVGTTVATAVGTGSSMGAVQQAYIQGWAGAFFGIGLGIGMFMLVWLFSDARNKNFMTFSEEISYYYGASKEMKGFTSIILFFAEVGWLGTHILGGSIYLSWITGIDPTIAKIVTALGFALYTVIGGYMAVVYTDVIQAIILFIGFIILGILAFIKVGGFQGLGENLPNEMTSFIGITQEGLIPGVSLVLVTVISVLVIPAYRHRIYSARNISVVKKSLIISGIVAVLFTVIPTVIGMAARVINPDMMDSAFAFPFMITELFPVWIGAFLLVAGLAATMSSGDSDAIASTTILVRDIYQVFTGKLPPREKTVLYSRIGLLFSIGLSLLFIIGSTNIIEYIENMSSTIMSGLFVAAVTGKFWGRSTWQGGTAAVVSGSMTSFIVILNDSLMSFWGNPIIPSLVIAFLTCVIVSYLTPKRKLSHKDALKKLEEERRVFEKRII